MSHQDEPDWSPKVLGPFSPASHHERRSTVWNHGDAPTAWVAAGGNNRRGKFFPRGCRGVIHQIEVYCRSGALGGGFNVYISPQPGMGYLYTGLIPLGVNAPAAWRALTLDIFWNYDSLFIWVYEALASCEVAYDTQILYDGHDSADAADTWAYVDRRYWIRMIFKGETAGDVPVSGTLNVVELMRRSSGVINELLTAPLGGGRDAYQVYGVGKATFIGYHIGSLGDLTWLIPEVFADDVQVHPFGEQTFVDIERLYIDSTASVPLFGWGKWDAQENQYFFDSALHIPFLREIRIGIRNLDPVAAHFVRLFVFIEYMR